MERTVRHEMNRLFDRGYKGAVVADRLVKRFGRSAVLIAAGTHGTARLCIVWHEVA
jgi:hypothetical protein